MSTLIKIIFLAGGVTYFLTRDGATTNDLLAGMLIVIFVSYALVKIDQLDRRQ